MSLEEDEDVCEARSSFSTTITDSPRPAASRAMPMPLMPPPMTSRSTVCISARQPRPGLQIKRGSWHCPFVALRRTLFLLPQLADGGDLRRRLGQFSRGSRVFHLAAVLAHGFFGTLLRFERLGLVEVAA